MKNSYYSLMLIFSFLLISYTLKAQENLVGTYSVSLQGVATGAVATIQKSGYQYLFTLAATGQATVQMPMQATEHGLVGVDNGTTCVVVAKGSDAVFQFGLLYTFLLTRTTNQPQQQSTNSQSLSSNTTKGELYNVLKNRQLLYMHTNNGYSSKHSYYLYEDGTYSTTNNTSYLSSNASSNFSGAGQSGGAGRWETREGNGNYYLILNGNTFTVTVDPNKKGMLFLNGKRYFVIGLNERY